MTFTTDLEPAADAAPQQPCPEPGADLSATDVAGSSGDGDVAAVTASKFQLREQARRLDMIRTYRKLQAKPYSLTKNQAVREILQMGYDTCRASLDRYCAILDTQGPDGLLGEFHAAGRTPDHLLTEDEAKCLKGLILARSTEHALHFSLAVEEFRFDEGCTPATSEIIMEVLDRAARRKRQPQWPKKWRQQAYPTQQEIAAFRGQKHAQEVEQTDRRACSRSARTAPSACGPAHLLGDGRRVGQRARQSTDADTGDEMLTRQTLFTQDVFSAGLWASRRSPGPATPTGSRTWPTTLPTASAPGECRPICGSKRGRFGTARSSTASCRRTSPAGPPVKPGAASATSSRSSTSSSRRARAAWRPASTWCRP
jgi:hypothetical protein